MYLYVNLFYCFTLLLIFLCEMFCFWFGCTFFQPVMSCSGPKGNHPKVLHFYYHFGFIVFCSLLRKKNDFVHPAAAEPAWRFSDSYHPIELCSLTHSDCWEWRPCPWPCWQLTEHWLHFYVQTPWSAVPWRDRSEKACWCTERDLRPQSNSS